MADRSSKLKLENIAEEEINPATEEKQDNLISQGESYTTLIDDYTVANKTYIGKAPAGSPENMGSLWQIKCIDETNDYPKIIFANGDSTFTHIWSDRLTYAYS